MTSTKERISPTRATETAAPGDGRRMAWTAGAVATLVLALGAWMLVGPSGGTPVPDDVEALLESYLAAWEDRDIEALEATTTSDYLLVEAIYTTGQDLADPDKVTLSRRLDVDLRALRNEFTNEAYEVDWAVEQSGDYIVAGDGPWFISVEETWADATINSRMSGTASYVILDDEGALRIAEHYWAGIRGWEGLDE